MSLLPGGGTTSVAFNMPPCMYLSIPPTTCLPLFPLTSSSNEKLYPAIQQRASIDCVVAWRGVALARWRFAASLTTSPYYSHTPPSPLFATPPLHTPLLRTYCTRHFAFTFLPPSSMPYAARARAHNGINSGSAWRVRARMHGSTCRWRGGDVCVYMHCDGLFPQPGGSDGTLVCGFKTHHGLVWRGAGGAQHGGHARWYALRARAPPRHAHARTRFARSNGADRAERR